MHITEPTTNEAEFPSLSESCREGWEWVREGREVGGKRRTRRGAR
jgi:hypothetical protein